MNTGSNLARRRRRFGRLSDDHGQTVLEYALIVAIVSIGMMVAINSFGSNLVASATSLVDGLLP